MTLIAIAMKFDIYRITYQLNEENTFLQLKKDVIHETDGLIEEILIDCCK